MARLIIFQIYTNRYYRTAYLYILGIQQFIAVRNGVVIMVLLLSFLFTGTSDIGANSAQCYRLVSRGQQARHISTSPSPLPVPVQIQNILSEV
jgi:hypothetical protein